MSRLILPCIFLLSLSPMFAWADTPVDAKQPVNVAAIITFVLFVLSTLLITWWAARRTHSRKEFLCGRRRYFRVAERDRHLRRFHVGGDFSRTYKSVIFCRNRRPDAGGRRGRQLAGYFIPDG